MSEPVDPGHVPDEWTLMAYADGRLDADSARGRELAAWLLKHPREWQRVEAYARQQREIRASFAAKFAEPVPAPLLPAAIRRQQRRQRWHRTGVAVGVAAIAGWAWVLPTLQRAPADSLDGFAQDVMQRIGTDAPSLPSAMAQPLRVLMPTGFRLAGERSLQASSGMLTEQLYQDAGGRHLRLFIGTDPRDPAIEPQWRHADGQHVVYWEADGRRYALAGEIDRSELQQLAAQMTQMPDERLQLAGDAAVAQTNETMAEAASATAFEPLALPQAAPPPSTTPASNPLDIGVDPYGQIGTGSEAGQPLL